MKKAPMALSFAALVASAVPALAGEQGAGPRAPVRFLGPPVRREEWRGPMSWWEMRRFEQRGFRRHHRMELRRHRRLGRMERRERRGDLEDQIILREHHLH